MERRGEEVKREEEWRDRIPRSQCPQPDLGTLWLHCNTFTGFLAHNNTYYSGITLLF